MVNTILYITILVNIITTLLINKSKSNDIYLLIYAYIGEMILIYGILYDSDYMKRISHIFFTLSIIIGSFFISEKYNLYFILICILSRFITYLIYDDCIFYTELYPRGYEIDIETMIYFHKYINWDHVYNIILVTTMYRIMCI